MLTNILLIILIIVLFLLICVIQKYTTVIEDQNKSLSEGLVHLTELEKHNIALINRTYEIMEEVFDIDDEDEEDDIDTMNVDNEVDEGLSGYEEV